MDEFKKKDFQLLEHFEEEFLFYKLQDIVFRQQSRGKLTQQEKLQLLCDEIIWLQVAKRISGFQEEMADQMLAKTITMDVLEDSSAYEQIVLPGISMEEEKINRKKKKVSAKMFLGNHSFIKFQYAVSIVEMLSVHDNRTLNDFLKYLCVDIPTGKKHSDLVEKLAESICSHPLWLLPVFSESAIKNFLKLAEQPDGEALIIGAENLNDYMQLTMWGFLSMQILDRDGKMYICLSVPGEIEEKVLPFYRQLYDEGLKGKEIVAYLDPEHTYKTHSLYHYYQELSEKIIGIVAAYGGISLDAMYRMTGDILEIPWGKEDFYRFIYLFETFHQKLSTGVNQQTKERYIGINADILEDILNDDNQRVTSYYPYQSYEEIEREYDKETDMWDGVYNILLQWDFETKELLFMVEEYRIWVSSGVSLTDILEELDREFSLDQVMDAVCLWRELLKIYLQCPCYFMKGYSRLQAEQEFGVDRFAGVFDEQSCTRIAKARIYELPIEIQKQLADMVILAGQGSYQTLLEQEKEIDKKYLANPSVGAVLVMNLVDAYEQMPSVEQGKWEDNVKQRIQLWCREIREAEARELMEDWCGQRGIYVNTRTHKKGKRKKDVDWEENGFYFGGEYEPIQKPVVKSDKIYPNDPCPCGSGKKYKKCCGRK